MKITIDAMERYLLDRYGGWAKEEGLFLKLVEELGEVAEVINMRIGSKKPSGKDLKRELGVELADMIHYIVAIAAVNDIDLASLILEKDREGSKKYNHDITLEQFIARENEKG